MQLNKRTLKIAGIVVAVCRASVTPGLRPNVRRKIRTWTSP